MKTSELHRASDRRVRLANLEPKVWLESSLLRTWVIAEPSLIIGLLRCPHAVILSIEEMVDKVERAYGAGFPDMKFAARHLPLFLEGDNHAERRRSFSRYLAARLVQLETHIPELVERHLGPLRGAGRVELVSEVTRPLVREITAILVGRQLTQATDALELLDLFALNKSLTRLRDLDRRVGRVVELLRAEDAGDELLGDRFTALVMGFETIMTMLTEGLYSAFRDASGAGSGIAMLPAHPVETGVPISYRRAADDFTMAGHAFKVGDLFRLQLQTLGYVARDDDRAWIFGTGTHSCVGKQVSLRIWAELKKAFDSMRARGRVISYELKPSHYLLRHDVIHLEIFR